MIEKLEELREDFKVCKELLSYAAKNKKKECMRFLYKEMENIYFEAVKLSSKASGKEKSDLLNFRNAIIDIIGYKM